MNTDMINMINILHSKECMLRTECYGCPFSYKEGYEFKCMVLTIRDYISSNNDLNS
jgi:hypothetical protein